MLIDLFWATEVVNLQSTVLLDGFKAKQGPQLCQAGGEWKTDPESRGRERFQWSFEAKEGCGGPVA